EVFLDPDTAHPQLVLSEDCRSVRWGETWQNLPNTQKRFEHLCCVLGQGGFTEGRHCWEVEGEVGKEPRWAIGVATETLNRQTKRSPSPLEKIWALQQRKGKLEALTEHGTSLCLSLVPKRIWVVLDCSVKQVTFVNADNGAEIYTFESLLFKRVKI
ncbi:BT1A1 protein, partial [Crypturellus soui]|nr:BT1A1 protein [Crypturellus soui]